MRLDVANNYAAGKSDGTRLIINYRNAASLQNGHMVIYKLPEGVPKDTPPNGTSADGRSFWYLDKFWENAPGEAIFIPGAEGRGEIRIELTELPESDIQKERSQKLIELAESLAERGQNVTVSSNGVEWSNTAGPIPHDLQLKLDDIIQGRIQLKPWGALLTLAEAKSAAANIGTLARSVPDSDGLALVREGNGFRLKSIDSVPAGSSPVTPDLVIAAWRNLAGPEPVYSIIRGPATLE
jgi:hypothetical protein